MRLAPLAPDELSDDQHELYDDIRAGIAKSLQGFESEDGAGALVGPFNPMLRFPRFGRPLWEFTASLAEDPTLPSTVREVAILTVGGHFHARYELYAHTRVGEAAGLTQATVATLAAGERPTTLSAEEAVAHDVAAALCRPGSLPEATYRAAVAAFGEDGTAELVHLVGAYALISMVLNAYDVPVPDSAEG